MIIISLISVMGAYLLPRKYESSTTILVQRDEILNPLIAYSMAVTLASEDRLTTFHEIIYSTRIIQTLVDSLQLDSGMHTEAQKQKLIQQLRKNIEVDRRASESFSIRYIDTDPVRAQRAASLLTRLFIRTKLTVENEQNERAVEFFERKLEEFREKFENSQSVLVSQMRQRINDLPVEDRLLYTRLDQIEQEITDFDTRIKTYQQALTVLRTYPAGLHATEGKKNLFELQRSDLPYVTELRSLTARYDEITARYTTKHPDVVKLESQIIEMLQRMQSAVESEISKEQTKRWELEKRRDQIVSELQQSSITHRVDQDKESNFGIYRQLYDDMKIKLEQARTTRDLGSGRANQFNVIDPALVPTEATKPSRLMIMVGGLAVALLLGIFCVIIAELLDSTVRSIKDVEVYQKPVIALIPDGFTELEK